MDNQYVVFELDRELYGVRIAAVESIIKMQGITRVPATPDFIEGVTNLRGKILPVVDLRKRLGLSCSAPTRESRIIVVSLGELQAGMLVDAVSEVLTIADAAVEDTPSMVTSVDTAYLTGIAKVDQRLVILLDLGRVLSAQETAALQQM